MSFRLRKRADLIREIECLREVLQTKNALQPADAVTFDGLRVGDLRFQFGDFLVRDTWRIGATRGASGFL